MAKRYRPTFTESGLGECVLVEDYYALRHALREALDTWELFTSEHDKGGRQRIAALRAQFLDDK